MKKVFVLFSLKEKIEPLIYRTKQTVLKKVSVNPKLSFYEFQEETQANHFINLISKDPKLKLNPTKIQQFRNQSLQVTNKKESRQNQQNSQSLSKSELLSQNESLKNKETIQSEITKTQNDFNNNNDISDGSVSKNIQKFQKKKKIFYAIYSQDLSYSKVQSDFLQVKQLLQKNKHLKCQQFQLKRGASVFLLQLKQKIKKKKIKILKKNHQLHPLEHYKKYQAKKQVSSEKIGSELSQKLKASIIQKGDIQNLKPVTDIRQIQKSSQDQKTYNLSQKPAQSLANSLLQSKKSYQKELIELISQVKQKEDNHENVKIKIKKQKNKKPEEHLKKSININQAQLSSISPKVYQASERQRQGLKNSQIKQNKDKPTKYLLIDQEKKQITQINEGKQLKRKQKKSQISISPIQIIQGQKQYLQDMQELGLLNIHNSFSQEISQTEDKQLYIDKNQNKESSLSGKKGKQGQFLQRKKKVNKLSAYQFTQPVIQQDQKNKNKQDGEIIRLKVQQNQKDFKIKKQVKVKVEQAKPKVEPVLTIKQVKSEQTKPKVEPVLTIKQVKSEQTKPKVEPALTIKQVKVEPALTIKQVKVEPALTIKQVKVEPALTIKQVKVEQTKPKVEPALTIKQVKSEQTKPKVEPALTIKQVKSEQTKPKVEPVLTIKQVKIEQNIPKVEPALTIKQVKVEPALTIKQVKVEPALTIKQVKVEPALTIKQVKVEQTKPKVEPALTIKQVKSEQTKPKVEPALTIKQVKSEQTKPKVEPVLTIKQVKIEQNIPKVEPALTIKQVKVEPALTIKQVKVEPALTIKQVKVEPALTIKQVKVEQTKPKVEPALTIKQVKSEQTKPKVEPALTIKQVKSEQTKPKVEPALTIKQVKIEQNIPKVEPAQNYKQVKVQIQQIRLSEAKIPDYVTKKIPPLINSSTFLYQKFNQSHELSQFQNCDIYPTLKMVQNPGMAIAKYILKYSKLKSQSLQNSPKNTQFSSELQPQIEVQINLGVKTREQAELLTIGHSFLFTDKNLKTFEKGRKQSLEQFSKNNISFQPKMKIHLNESFMRTKKYQYRIDKNMIQLQKWINDKQTQNGNISGKGKIERQKFQYVL